MAEVAVGARRDNVGRGIALALAAIPIFSTQDSTSKLLVETVAANPSEIRWLLITDEMKSVAAFTCTYPIASACREAP